MDIFAHPGWAKPRLSMRASELPAPPQPGFYLMRTRAWYDPMTQTTHRGKWIIPALIYRPCPWVQPGVMPYEAGMPGPEDWCRPSERPRPLRAMIAGVEREEGSSWGDPCSAAQQIWEWGRRITATEYADALAAYQPEVTNV